jgi:hypothetical protein
LAVPPLKFFKSEIEMLAHTWPRQRECAAYYGKPGTGHSLLDLPYPMRIAWEPHVSIRRITIHEKCAASAARVLERTRAHYGVENIRELGLDLFGGCFNNRPMRGGTALSMHAYACAIDFDPARNLLKWNGRKARLAQPDAARFWEFWEEEGWVSLGRTRDFDWMHVQAARF